MTGVDGALEGPKDNQSFMSAENVIRSSFQCGNLSGTCSQLIAQETRLPKGRLGKLKSLLLIEDLKPNSIDVSESIPLRARIQESLLPISLEPHNAKALYRLFHGLFPNENEIDPSNNMELSEPCFGESYNFVMSKEYVDLYRRFECLFVWPYLLGSLPLD